MTDAATRLRGLVLTALVVGAAVVGVVALSGTAAAAAPSSRPRPTAPTTSRFEPRANRRRRVRALDSSGGVTARAVARR